MSNTRFLAVLLIGSLMTATAFASGPSASTASTLSKDQISTIQKDCAKTNSGSMTSTAYKECVKTKEDAAAHPTKSHK